MMTMMCHGMMKMIRTVKTVNLTIRFLMENLKEFSVKILGIKQHFINFSQKSL